MSESKDADLIISIHCPGPMELGDLVTALGAIEELFALWTKMEPTKGVNFPPQLGVHWVRDGSMEFGLGTVGAIAKGAVQLGKFLAYLRDIFKIGKRRWNAPEQVPVEALARSVVNSNSKIQLKIGAFSNLSGATILVLDKQEAQGILNAISRQVNHEPPRRYLPREIFFNQRSNIRRQTGTLSWSITSVGERLAYIPQISRVPKPFSLDVSIDPRIFNYSRPISVTVDVVRMSGRILSYNIISFED
jgi:hypothetical protein